MDDRIDILLGVYNGADYLDAAIASVEAQTHENWTLLVRDDGSTDATPQKLTGWQERLGARMRLLSNPERVNLGMNGNFAALLTASTAPYVTHLSHDDIYHPNRLAISLAAVQAREAVCPAGRPVLAFTDMRVIDEAGVVTAPSLWRLIGWHPPQTRALGRLLVQNGVAGGAMLANRPLVGLVNGAMGRGQRASVLYDDKRFGCLAAAVGELVPVIAQTADFRRHSNNRSELISLGATLGLLLAPLRLRRTLHDRLARVRQDAVIFLGEFGDILPEPDRQALQALIDLPAMSSLSRRRAILRHGLLYSSHLRNLGLLALI